MRVACGMPVKELPAQKRTLAPRKMSVKCRTLQEIGATVVAGGRGQEVLQEFAEMMRDRCKYRWVGFYRILRHDFVLEAHSGETKPAYVQFPLTQGLTAVAVETQKTQNIRDVSKDKRFLPNFWTTKSEIIVPIIDDEHEKVVGVINVESSKLNAFDKEDCDFLEGVARLIWRVFR